MENRLENSRAALAVSLVVAIFVAVATVVSSPPALASHVEPVLGSTLGNTNPSCEFFTDGGTEFKIESDEGELQEIYPGTTTHTDGTLTVTLTIYETEDGWEFDWTTNFGVDVVVVKGGPDANVYFYDPIETSDDGLHSPENPATGQWYGLSHISFCYFAENATTTTTSTTTTTTLAAEEEETTTTTSSTTTTTTLAAEEEETTTTTSSTTTTTEATTTTTTTLAAVEEEETTTTTESTTTTTVEDEVLGTVITATTEAPTTTVEDEVLGTEVSPSTLPFTGVESEHLAMLAMTLLGGGLLLVVGASASRRVNEE